MPTPPDHDWDAVRDFAVRHACQWSMDPEHGSADWGIHLKDPPPHNQLLGPVFTRGDACGIVQQGDRILAQWGDTSRADMTFSVTKTYLALVAGIAFDQGLLGDPDEPVVERVRLDSFSSDHNRQITWSHLLQFTSEWQGECWGVPDWVDHHRRAGFQAAAPAGTPDKGTPRQLHEPGTFWEYNDIRINQFSLALMHLFERPLPEVFDQYIASPLGMSSDWQWHGYDNSWVTLNGTRMQSVPGGGHWGGGMQISALDQLLVGRLLLSRGKHQGNALVSEGWVNRMVTPCTIAPFYGYFTWLNKGDNPIPNASADSFFSLGIGGQIVWHEPAADLVTVLRWTDQKCLGELCGMVLERVG